MEAILQRLLEAERQGDEIVKQAEAEAEACIEDSRREAVGLREALQRDIDQQAKDLIAKRVAQAEERKTAALREADGELSAREKALRQTLAAAVEVVGRRLAGLDGNA